ncbi:MAG: ActS/PrrB/RegB family redox-sensitive histidine kinase [Pseudomonadota bacterium]
MRLRTLVTVRWFAIAGQLMAVFLAQQLYEIVVPFFPCLIAIGLSVMGNLVAITAYPDNRRLSEAETVFMLLFDILQLSFLLALTGGMNNPFAVLVLAPVTIAATVLPTRLTLFLGSVAVFLITLVSSFHLPLVTQDGTILQMPAVFAFGFWVAILVSIAFIAVYTRRVTIETAAMAEALLATQMALAREQKLTDLGGVVAATAHELGTPLATIKLVSSELVEELHGQDDLQADAQLIGDQAKRCGDILKSMGRAGKDDTHLRTAPLIAVVEEAADPHIDRGKSVEFAVLTDDEDHPTIPRKPEVIHGLRNLIQNAVDFADTTVFVEVDWSDDRISVKISDDGKGFSPHIISRLGDPFVRRRFASNSSDRPGYEGMGLGLFIAKTLLERSGARVTFSNGFDPMVPRSESLNRGAVILVDWPRQKIQAEPPQALGQNPTNSVV